MKLFVFNFLFAVFVLSFFYSSPVYAKTAQQCCLDNRGTGDPGPCYQLDATQETACIPDIFPPAKYFDDPTSIVNILLPNLILIAGIILFLLVVFAGFQMVTSGGDATKMEKWRSMLMYGIIGFVVVLFAFVAIQLVEFFTGANILNPEEVFKQ